MSVHLVGTRPSIKETTVRKNVTTFAASVFVVVVFVVALLLLLDASCLS